MCTLHGGHNGFYAGGDGTGGQIELDAAPVFDSLFTSYLGNVTDTAVNLDQHLAIHDKLNSTGLVDVEQGSFFLAYFKGEAAGADVDGAFSHVRALKFADNQKKKV